MFALALTLASILAVGRASAAWPVALSVIDDSSVKADTTMVAASSLASTDSVSAAIDSLIAATIDTAAAIPADLTPAKGRKQRVERRDWSSWRPDAKRSMWLGMVIPGAGQIYNRKYWKLPIIYGGFVGCAYAIRWNNQMYHDYAQAYMDIMDNDPSTQSYNSFLHLGTTITTSNTSRYQTLFKKRKDFYRRYRDLSIFCLIGVYALSVIDAYVDASLSEFDISPDLSLRLEPAVINDGRSANPLKSNALGLQCYLSF